VAVFIAADEGYHSDLFPAHVSTAWFGAYWIVFGVLLVYVFGYAARVMLIVRKDPRSTVTATLYLISAAFGVAATVIQVVTAEAGIDITLPVWLCACLGAIGFAYGSARSWHAKVAWFRDGKIAPPPRPDH
jgi:xanthine/uracil permease